jgi:hypothetical protein
MNLHTGAGLVKNEAEYPGVSITVPTNACRLREKMGEIGRAAVRITILSPDAVRPAPCENRCWMAGGDPVFATACGSPRASVGERLTIPDNTRFNGGFAKVDITLARADLTVGRMTHCQSLTNR